MGGEITSGGGGFSPGGTGGGGGNAQSITAPLKLPVSSLRAPLAPPWSYISSISDARNIDCHRTCEATLLRVLTSPPSSIMSSAKLGMRALRISQLSASRMSLRQVSKDQRKTARKLKKNYSAGRFAGRSSGSVTSILTPNSIMGWICSYGPHPFLTKLRPYQRNVLGSSLSSRSSAALSNSYKVTRAIIHDVYVLSLLLRPQRGRCYLALSSSTSRRLNLSGGRSGCRGLGVRGSAGLGRHGGWGMGERWNRDSAPGIYPFA
jgi:hypothetical protein